MPAAERRRVFAWLVVAFDEGAALPAGERWLTLEAAHVVGQPLIGLHTRSHLLMLCHALEQADWREAAGQLLRLALVVPGHLLRRLPAGNTGRATVPARRPMPPQPAVEAWIARALAALAPTNPGPLAQGC
ncbi:MAG: DUF3703 domain-containing protein [Burkholderiaceae bacterium]|nr:DUF3703 domain-containing protein [Burkholderiaceae bacterium]